METSARVHIENREGDILLTFDLVTKNISAGGVFFQTDSPLAGGTRVNIELDLAAGRKENITSRTQGHGFHVKVGGTVVRSVPDGMAVAFDDNYQIAPLRS